jgi:hypothetical protein
MGGAGSNRLATINLAAAHIPPLYKAISIPDSSTGLLPQCLHAVPHKSQQYTVKFLSMWEQKMKFYK